jgi:hypothetical protein
MHIGGMGDTTRMASAVKAVYDQIAKIRSAQASPSSAFRATSPRRAASRWHRSLTVLIEGDEEINSLGPAPRLRAPLPTRT